LRQSRSMCPFLHKTSPATLRSLSTTAASHDVSPSAGSMSNLQVLGRRCPIMGKALAVQSARIGNSALAGAFGGVRAYHSRVNRAKLHTTSHKEAHVEPENVRSKQSASTPGLECVTRHLRHFRGRERMHPNSQLTRMQALFTSHPPSPLQPLLLHAPDTSITSHTTRPSWTRSTRTSRTATSTTSTASPRSSPEHTRNPTMTRLPCGAPTTTSAWVATPRC
jgi:hypothetical protein